MVDFSLIQKLIAPIPTALIKGISNWRKTYANIQLDTAQTIAPLKIKTDLLNKSFIEKLGIGYSPMEKQFQDRMFDSTALGIIPNLKVPAAVTGASSFKYAALIIGGLALATVWIKR